MAYGYPYSNTDLSAYRHGYSLGYRHSHADPHSLPHGNCYADTRLGRACPHTNPLSWAVTWAMNRNRLSGLTPASLTL